jgi:hypothetical protein
MKRLLGFMVAFFCLMFSIATHGNSSIRNYYSGNNVINIEQDTIIYRELEKIDIYPRKGFKMNSREYTRLVAKIKKVYPFAKEAAIELQRYNEMYEKITNPRKRRQYVRKVEKELFAKHENDIRHITVSEGRYMLLLIDRETGDCSYELIKEIKGSFSAFFWQGIAKIFHNDLREEYDPVYKHFVIEQIVQSIEQGKL